MMIKTDLSSLIRIALRRFRTRQCPVALDSTKQVPAHGLTRPLGIARPDRFGDFGMFREEDPVAARQRIDPAHGAAEFHAGDDPAADMLEKGLEPAVVGGLRDRHVEIEISLVSRQAALDQLGEYLKLGLDLRLLGGGTP